MSLNVLQRLRTFHNYPDLSKVSAAVLANNGFIYTGDGATEKVLCVGCNMEKRDWKVDDNVEDVHKINSPHCPVLSEINKVNKPFGDVNKFNNCVNSAALTNEVNYSNEDSSNTPLESLETSLAQNPTQTQSKGNNSNTRRNASFLTRSNAVPEPLSSNTLARDSLQAVAPFTDERPSTITHGQPSQTLFNSKHLTVKNHQANSVKPASNPTYSELGIITDKPKHPELSLKPKRLETFKNWPTDHHLKRENLAEAGFYYAGHGDCARCFYCGGGLRNWETGDDVWVEHARWFSKCAFIRQQMGQMFIDTVQDLNKTHEKKISFLTVKNAISAKSWSVYFETQTNPLKRDPAVRAMIEHGYLEQDVLQAAEQIKKDNVLSSDVLYQQLKSDKQANKQLKQQKNELGATNNIEDQEIISQIKKENIQMREQTLCKICMDSEVEVVFLPCGHLVSCKDCSVALSDCPVCRKPLKGMVRAFFG
ncbi:hypothetical protein Btru_068733 [Bulinus truncatus]|nr:hypothetical protein Btru_068733 [Bulinus truncatus]